MKIYDAQVQTAKIHYDNMSESSFIRLKINYIITTQESPVLCHGTCGRHRKVFKLEHHVWPMGPSQDHQLDYRLQSSQVSFYRDIWKFLNIPHFEVRV